MSRFLFLLSVLFLIFPLVLRADNLININTASAQKLQELPGIGPAKSESIVDYRNQNGLFQAKEEIKKVSGIGDKTYDDIKDLITVSSSGDDGADNPETDEENKEKESDDSVEDNDNNNDNDSQESSSGGGTMKYSLEPEELEAFISAEPSRATVNTPIKFTSKSLYGDRESVSAKRIWSMGNGDVMTGREIEYSYADVGKYVVVFSSEMYEHQDQAEVVVEIVRPEIKITSVVPGPRGYVEIENNDSRIQDISNWYIESGVNKYKIPNHTKMAGKSRIKVYAKTLSFNPQVGLTVFLKYPNGRNAWVYRPGASYGSSRALPEKGKSISQVNQNQNLESKEEIDDDLSKLSTSTQVASVSAGLGSVNTDIWLWALVGIIGLAIIAVLVFGSIWGDGVVKNTSEGRKEDKGGSSPDEEVSEYTIIENQ